MAIEFQCPSCNKVFRVEDKFGGKTAKCPGCESQIQIPAASATQEPPAVPHVDTTSPPPEQPSAQKTAPQKPTEVPPFMAAESSSPKPSAAPEINPFAATTAAAAAPTSASLQRGKLVLKRIDVASAAKMVGAFYAFIGLLVGVFGGLFTMVGGLANSANSQAIALGVGGGLAMMLMAPLFYGLLGAIGGAIGAVFYNLAAKYAGGLKFDVG